MLSNIRISTHFLTLLAVLLSLALSLPLPALAHSSSASRPGVVAGAQVPGLQGNPPSSRFEYSQHRTLLDSPFAPDFLRTPSPDCQRHATAAQEVRFPCSSRGSRSAGRAPPPTRSGSHS